jgi:OOP family OmpA-OmpF porin
MGVSIQNTWRVTMKKINTLLTCLLLLPILSHASESSFYGGLGYGTADYEGETYEDGLLESNQRLEDDTGFAEIYAGYRINKYISIEAAYSDFNSVSTTYSRNNLMSFNVPNDREEVDITKLSLGGVFEWPIFNEFSVIGLVGYSYFELDRELSGGFSVTSGNLGSSDSDEGIYYGVGLKYDFNDLLSTRVQWIEDSPKDIEMSSYRLSLEFNF